MKLIYEIFRRLPFSIIVFIVYGTLFSTSFILYVYFDYEWADEVFIVSSMFVYISIFWMWHDAYIAWRKQQVKSKNDVLFAENHIG